MKLSKEEKKCWQRHYRIEKLQDIPTEMSGFSSIDGDADDELMFYFAKRVSIPEMYLKCTDVTDEGVKHISSIRNLKELTIADHINVTKASIPYFNEMRHLESLNIIHSEITLSDLCESLNNQNLKTLFVSSEENEENIVEKGFILKERMPKCDVYLDTYFVTDGSGNPETPIF
ncbi:hypothetical protein QRD02_04815 [Aequorivita sp. SDUM287046]|uniref:Leucine-rich repeat domain-containing protein n=1 Tax=Aequorivita aurantiaca TaxID=3053356 RepID=A0ABT8DEU2_9FLAO|nr:hypothetical protein [Aequorivita aurantiaca]MDN3723693.1 hypothetical protein [Aequorivita aurantiaca]